MQGPSFPTRNWSYGPWSGSRESQPLNCQGSSLEYVFFKKIPESSKKHNLNLMCTGNYLHNIHIVFISVYIAFTLN